MDQELGQYGHSDLAAVSQVHLLPSEAKPVSYRYWKDVCHLFLLQTGSLNCTTESTSTPGKMKITLTEELLLSGLYTKAPIRNEATLYKHRKVQCLHRKTFNVTYKCYKNVHSMTKQSRYWEGEEDKLTKKMKGTESDPHWLVSGTYRVRYGQSLSTCI